MDQRWATARSTTHQSQHNRQTQQPLPLMFQTLLEAQTEFAEKSKPVCWGNLKLMLKSHLGATPISGRTTSKTKEMRLPPAVKLGQCLPRLAVYHYFAEPAAAEASLPAEPCPNPPIVEPNKAPVLLERGKNLQASSFGICFIPNQTAGIDCRGEDCDSAG